MSTTITTITPTILANLHTKLGMYRAKRDDIAHRNDYVIRPSQVWLETGFVPRGSPDVIYAELDKQETNHSNRPHIAESKYYLFRTYSLKVAVLECFISDFPNIMKAFEEECGEFDDALFTLWYQR